jgi:translation initiation factor IF-3
MVKVVDDSGIVGVMPVNEALNLASTRSLDLVKISPHFDPPVCKIMDYGKFCFNRKKKEKEAKKNQHISEIKEIRLSLNIGKADLETKVGHAKVFINNGDKVKVSIKLKGRENQHPEVARKVMKTFSELCTEFAFVEIPLNLEARQMVMIISKIKNVKQASER